MTVEIRTTKDRLSRLCGLIREDAAVASVECALIAITVIAAIRAAGMELNGVLAAVAEPPTPVCGLAVEQS